MDFEEREFLIHEHFIKKMTTMYMAPKNVRDSMDAKKLYGEELRRAINTRLSSNIPNKDVFKDELQKIWDRCVSNHMLTLWFTPSLIAKQAAKVNHEYVQRTMAVQSNWDKLTVTGEDAETGEVRAGKNDPIGQGWTIEKCDWHIAETQRLMEEEGLNRHMGQVLIRIPRKAKERLLALDKQVQTA